ncbi:5'-deoxynucleotidase [Exiguobacterium sp. RIT452]|uniref:YfbR-like 5'-deoxynucleotidase n=1 Tax=Exiguobacterium TaxID=33986 RepID=UPI00047CBDD3|nr:MULTISPECIES: YfbR-like 5'-deoxynucleotidase [Exiguobacterium]RJO96830.1 5'-deoxynucleotidase [Exiguobacterium sp. RIT452]
MQNGNFIRMLTRMQNVPRWDEYAPRFPDNAASHSFRVALFSLMASYIEEEATGVKLDRLSLLGKALFHDMNEVITGPIKHRTKKEPTLHAHIQAMEQQASEKLVALLSKSLQPDFTNYLVFAEDDSREGQMVEAVDTFDAMLFAKREADMTGSTFFKAKTAELQTVLLDHPIHAIRTLTHSVFAEDTMSRFIDNVLMMDTIRRWKGRFNTIDDNDATHAFRAASLGLFNGLIESKKYGVEIDTAEVVSRLLCHDLVEGTTGDVLGPVKHATPVTAAAFEAYERTEGEALIHLLPASMQREFHRFVVEAKDETYEGQMVDVVDKLDALIKMNMERKLNGVEYETGYRAQLKKVQTAYENPSVVFFLAYVLHDLDYVTS